MIILFVLPMMRFITIKQARMMMTTDPWITLGFNYEQCLQAFEGNSKEIYILEITNEMAGFVIIVRCVALSMVISRTICIKEEYRGKGLGKKLLQFCEERIHQISPNVFICVSEFNVRPFNCIMNMDLNT